MSLSSKWQPDCYGAEKVDARELGEFTPPPPPPLPPPLPHLLPPLPFRVRPFLPSLASCSGKKIKKRKVRDCFLTVDYVFLTCLTLVT